MKKGKKWYKSFSSWLVIIACIILVPILISNIFIIFQAKTQKDKVPDIFGYKPFIVLSGSMEGKIHKGDLIITKITDPTTLKINDIIAFRDAENTVTTHRIIDVVKTNGKTQFITKGDNNSTQDRNLVSLEDVEGIYVTKISGFGSMMNSLAEPTTILALSLLITVMFVIGFMISMQKDKKLEREEFYKYKMMKENQESKKEHPEQDELLELRKLREQQKEHEELMELRRLKEEQQRKQQEQDELLKLRQLREEQQREQRQNVDLDELLRLRKQEREQQNESSNRDQELLDLLREYQNKNKF